MRDRRLRVTLVGVQSTQGTLRQALTSYVVQVALPRDGGTEERVNMSLNTVVDSAMPVYGFLVTGLERNTVASGSEDLLETRSFFFGTDGVSRKGYAR
jgi:hypothetical protein